jgi:hypothetical protein
MLTPRGPERLPPRLIPGAPGQTPERELLAPAKAISEGRAGRRGRHRRRYGRLDRFLDGFLVIGDAACCVDLIERPERLLRPAMVLRVLRGQRRPRPALPAPDTPALEGAP